MITSLQGTVARPIGLAAHPRLTSRFVRCAFDEGVNYFFTYGPGHLEFNRGLVPLIRRSRDDTIVATGSGARNLRTLETAKRKIFSAMVTDMVDVFFAEYVRPDEDPRVIFDAEGVLDELQRWKDSGCIRFVGATVHDRTVAARLARDRRVDVLMHRFNMAHRKAISEVFPAATRTRTPIIAFTATRWGTLLKPYAGLPGPAPTAVDCYLYCLAYPAVQLVLTAPKTIQELNENLKVLTARPMNKADCKHWEQYGDRLRSCDSNAFETRWP